MHSPVDTSPGKAKPAHPMRGRATTIEPEILQQIAMADKQVVIPDKLASYEIPSSSVRSSSAGMDSRTTTGVTDDGQIEKFPDFLNTKSESLRKAKSLSTSATVDVATFADKNRASAIDRMKTISPPLDLQQARQRRESVKDSAKEIRKASIGLIRSRTVSRAEAQGRPNLEDLKPLEESEDSG